jgi:membrane fusion protein, epimerase transport system
VTHVRVGQAARVRFTAFKHRGTQLVAGKVSYVAGDRLDDPATGAPYYGVLIAADPRSLESAGDLKLQAGMPAEVYVQGASQTPLQYLAEPITSTFRKAGRPL